MLRVKLKGNSTVNKNPVRIMAKSNSLTIPKAFIYNLLTSKLTLHLDLSPSSNKRKSLPKPFQLPSPPQKHKIMLR